MKAKQYPSIDVLSHYFMYDKNTGILYWKNVNLKSKMKSGDIAGSLSKDGYLRVMLNGFSYVVHRIILIMSGFLLSSEDVVDHKNGIKTDNTLDNLRIVDKVINARNRNLTSYTKSKRDGVHWDNKLHKWRVRISTNSGRIRLGAYSILEDAIKVREAAEFKYGYLGYGGK